MISNISAYVSMAFKQAGDLVKKVVISEETKGSFDPLTGRYASSTKTFTAEMLDNDEDEMYNPGRFSNSSVRSYIVKSSDELVIGQKFEDDSKIYTIFRVKPIQQNSVVFIYLMWAEV